MVKVRRMFHKAVALDKKKRFKNISYQEEILKAKNDLEDAQKPASIVRKAGRKKNKK